jgi:hypothetical protein
MPRNIEHVGSLVHAKTAEESELDDLAPAQVELGETFQGFVERQPILPPFRAGCAASSREIVCMPPPRFWFRFERARSTRMRRIKRADSAKKCAPIWSPHCPHVHQAQVELIDRRRGCSVWSRRSPAIARCARRHCQFCHGPKGLGDGKSTPKGMKPANLADDEWDRGSTDGEIHAVIVGGIPDKKMPGVKGRVSDADIWHIVNYIHNLGHKAAAR